VLAAYRLVKVIKMVFGSAAEEYSPFEPSFLN